MSYSATFTNLKNPKEIKEELSFCKIMTLGFAIFSMFFGSGNLVFPLSLGQETGLEFFWATLGLILSGICVPFLGLWSMILSRGSLEDLFKPLGLKAEFILPFLMLTLLGPFGVVPRCITVAYAGLSPLFSGLSLELFSFFFCGLTFFMISKGMRMIEILGKILTPFLLLSLVVIIGAALKLSPEATLLSFSTPLSAFLKGVTTGYHTMDLMAAFFFGTFVLNTFRKNEDTHQSLNPRSIRGILYAMMLGTSILTAIYGCMVCMGAYFTPYLLNQPPQHALGLIAHATLGSAGGITTVGAVFLACLTTGVALTKITVDFTQEKIFKSQRASSLSTGLILSLTFLFSLIEFDGIARFLEPILKIFYPGLILLTVLSILKHYQYEISARIPTYGTFLGTAFYQLVWN